MERMTLMALGEDGAILRGQDSEDSEEPSSAKLLTTRRLGGVSLVLSALLGAAVLASRDSQSTSATVDGVADLLIQAEEEAPKSTDCEGGPPESTFYMYRAQGDASYPLENVNTANLAGVMWYLHNEVVVATPRKYGIDRIKRFKFTVKNTWEFWNVHHRMFGPFGAYDAARCTTPDCGTTYNQYGFIVGCQPCDGSAFGYENPQWYSLPGTCPIMGMQQRDIEANQVAMDVNCYKSDKCKEELPGGRCDRATGAPDCTYSVEEAGFIMLDEMAGIENYTDFWRGTHNKEYQVSTDTGVNCTFWDGAKDEARCAARMTMVRTLFKKKYPDMPEELGDEGTCDFDMWYQDEMTWPQNHTCGVKPSRGFKWGRDAAADEEEAKTIEMECWKKERKAAKDRHHGEHLDSKVLSSCEDYGCTPFNKNHGCQCNDGCYSHDNCCHDYEEVCKKSNASKRRLL